MTNFPASISRRTAVQFFGWAALFPAALARAAGAPWQPLFNGSTLAGWRPAPGSPHSKASGNRTAGRWFAEAGVILGNQDTPGNGGLLLTGADYGDQLEAGLARSPAQVVVITNPNNPTGSVIPTGRLSITSPGTARYPRFATLPIIPSPLLPQQCKLPVATRAQVW